MTEESVGPYEGGDIVGHIMKAGFELYPGHGAIESITKVRDGAVVVTTYSIFHFKPDWGVGFSCQKIADF